MHTSGRHVKFFMASVHVITQPHQEQVTFISTDLFSGAAVGIEVHFFQG